MITEFVENGTRYSIEMTSMGLRERQALTADIKPDASLWTSAQKKKHRKFGYVEDYTPKRLKGGHEQHSQLKPPRPEEFEDNPEFR